MTAKINRKPRVLHIVPAQFNEKGVIGGAERYALELARHMAEQVPTTLVSFGEKPSTQKLGALRVRVLKPLFHFKGESMNPISPRLIREIMRADIVHCHQYRVLNSSLTALLGQLTRKPVFVSDLGGGASDISYRIPTEKWYRGHLHISRYSRHIAGHDNKPWAHIIMGGVDIDKFSPDPSVVKDDTVRFVGRILPHKGVDDLVNGLPAQIQLEIIGKPYNPEYMVHLQQIAAGKQVTFRHNCDDATLVEAYRKALCLVLPSVYKASWGHHETSVPELLGQTLLEGMACGTPAICTDVASMPEVVEDGVTGFVVPPNDPAAIHDKLCWLRDHPVQAAEMGREARKRVCEQFTWSHTVQRCLEIYQG